jgi:hypothetical protein
MDGLRNQNDRGTSHESLLALGAMTLWWPQRAKQDFAAYLRALGKYERLREHWESACKLKHMWELYLDGGGFILKPIDIAVDDVFKGSVRATWRRDFTSSPFMSSRVRLFP